MLMLSGESELIRPIVCQTLVIVSTHGRRL